MYRDRGVSREQGKRYRAVRYMAAKYRAARCEAARYEAARCEAARCGAATRYQGTGLVALGYGRCSRVRKSKMENGKWKIENGKLKIKIILGKDSLYIVPCRRFRVPIACIYYSKSLPISEVGILNFSKRQEFLLFV